MLKPLSLLELSVHVNWISVVDSATPLRLLGAFGTEVGVGVGLAPHVGKRKDPILVRQLKLVVDA